MYDDALAVHIHRGFGATRLSQAYDGLPLDFFRRPGSGIGPAGAGRFAIEDRKPSGEGAGPPEKIQRPRTFAQLSLRLDARLFAHLEGLDDVTFVDVVVRAKTDTTLEVRADLGGVVLEALERLNGEVVADDLAVAADAGLGVAPDNAGADDRACNVAELGRAEDLADLGRAQLDLFVLRLEHALEGCFDVSNCCVDDGVEAHVHAFAVCQFGNPLGGLDVEADDDGGVDRGQVDVVLRDGTDAAVDDAEQIGRASCRE